MQDSQTHQRQQLQGWGPGVHRCVKVFIGALALVHLPAVAADGSETKQEVGISQYWYVDVGSCWHVVRCMLSTVLHHASVDK